MKSRLWIAGAILLAASMYSTRGVANDQRFAEYIGPDEGYQEVRPPADMSSEPVMEGTVQKGEIETGKLPSLEPGDSNWKSGFEAFEPRPEAVEQNGVPYRLDTDAGP